MHIFLYILNFKIKRIFEKRKIIRNDGNRKDQIQGNFPGKQRDHMK